MKKFLTLIFISLVFASASINHSFAGGVLKKAKEKFEDKLEKFKKFFARKKEPEEKRGGVIVEGLKYTPTTPGRRMTPEEHLEFQASFQDVPKMKEIIKQEKPNINWQNPKEDNRTILAQMAKDGKISSVRTLIEAGAKVDIPDKDGATALYWAAYDGHAEIVNDLINAGANVNKQDNNGMTPLMWSAGWSYPIVVDLLIKNGADVKIRENEGHTAIDIAASGGANAKIAEVLINKGANVNNRDNDGWTPLMQAAYALNYSILPFADYPKIIEFLLKKGADPTLKNKDGKSALDYAKESKADQTIKAAIIKLIEVKLKELKK